MNRRIAFAMFCIAALLFIGWPSEDAPAGEARDEFEPPSAGHASAPQHSTPAAASLLQSRNDSTEEHVDSCASSRAGQGDTCGQ